MAASDDQVTGAIPRKPWEGLIPEDYGLAVKTRTTAIRNQVKYAPLTNRHALVKHITTIKKSSRLAQIALCEDGHPEIANLILRNVSDRVFFSQVPATYIDSNGKRVSVGGLILLMETRFLSLSYQDAMIFLLKSHEGLDFAPDFIRKRIRADPAFQSAFEDDELFKYLLVHAKRNMAQAFPDVAAVPLPEKAQQYIFRETCHELHFRKLPLTPEQQDIIHIHQLLTNPDLMLKQLDKLESALNAAISARWQERGEKPPASDVPMAPVMDYRLFQKPYPKDREKPFLFTFFEDWSRVHTFSELVRLDEVQTDQGFTKMLQEKKLFKDTAFGGIIHGAWTHLIQWYCITAAARDKDITLQSAPTHLLQYMADHGGSQNFLWDRTFESTPERTTRRDIDFRSVTFFNRFLNNEGHYIERCPTLYSLLRYRTLRDEEAKKNSPPPGSA